MIKISTPVQGYNGIDCGVRFENGVAIVEELTEHVKNWFIDQGYTVEESKEKSKATDNVSKLETGDEDKKDNKPLTKKELLSIAEGLEIETNSKMTNAELEALIEAKKIEIENAESNNQDAKDNENASNDNENNDNASSETGDEDKKGE